MTVRVRGIYATALTEYLANVVQASTAIRERFEEEPERFLDDTGSVDAGHSHAH